MSSLALSFGVLGYILGKLHCEPAPFVLGFILGPSMEENFRRAMQMARGDPTTFLTRLISAVLLILALLLILVSVMPALRRRRDEAFQEDG